MFDTDTRKEIFKVDLKLNSIYNYKQSADIFNFYTIGLYKHQEDRDLSSYQHISESYYGPPRFMTH